MKITVQRSGGVAAITRVWTVDAATSEDKQRWMPIVEACPWDQVPTRGRASAQAAARAPGKAAGKPTGSCIQSAPDNTVPRSRRPRSPGHGTPLWRTPR
ncbi:hypothetical protein AHiyo8_56300 [Arthrobacter sp. Hiyo8]|nr:hypothetical protein AHiyo8_56300 [Arthrobacter sp. Hiyo8]